MVTSLSNPLSTKKDWYLCRPSLLCKELLVPLWGHIINKPNLDTFFKVVFKFFIIGLLTTRLHSFSLSGKLSSTRSPTLQICFTNLFFQLMLYHSTEQQVAFKQSFPHYHLRLFKHPFQITLSQWIIKLYVRRWQIKVRNPLICENNQTIPPKHPSTN